MQTVGVPHDRSIESRGDCNLTLTAALDGDINFRHTDCEHRYARAGAASNVSGYCRSILGLVS